MTSSSQARPASIWAKAKQVNSRLGSSYLGRSLQIGSKEALGTFYSGSAFGVQRVANEGFLGIRGTTAELGAMSKLSKSQYLGKFAWRTAGKSLGLVATAAMAYEGYKSNGLIGAAGGVAESALWSAGIRAAGGVIGSAPMAIGLGIAATGMAVYETGEAAKRYNKRLRKLEMGGDYMQDALLSAGAATNRQRSMMALQNTHLNGRMALGNEAFLMHPRLY